MRTTKLSQSSSFGGLQKKFFAIPINSTAKAAAWTTTHIPSYDSWDGPYFIRTYLFILIENGSKKTYIQQQSMIHWMRTHQLQPQDIKSFNSRVYILIFSPLLRCILLMKCNFMTFHAAAAYPNKQVFRKVSSMPIGLITNYQNNVVQQVTVVLLIA